MWVLYLFWKHYFSLWIIFSAKRLRAGGVCSKLCLHMGQDWRFRLTHPEQRRWCWRQENTWASGSGTSRQIMHSSSSLASSWTWSIAFIPSGVDSWFEAPWFCTCCTCPRFWPWIFLKTLSMLAIFCLKNYENFRFCSKKCCEY